MKHPLVYDYDNYGRDLNIVKGYVESNANLLALSTGRSYDECRNFIVAKLNSLESKDVMMKVISRDEVGDRVKTTIGFRKYLHWVNTNGHIMAPNMISYKHPSVEPSYTSLFIKENLTLRSTIKKSGQRKEQLAMATQEESEALFKENKVTEALELEAKYKALYDDAYFDNLDQGNKKFFNNSSSGASASEHNPLYYLTKHTTFTSLCATSTSNANLINEQLLASNRHYYSYEITLDHIGYILGSVDMSKLQGIMTKYNISYPTVEEVKGVITKSCRTYFDGHEKIGKIYDLIMNMSDVQRAALLYYGDLHSLCRYGGKVMRDFYDGLILKENYGEYGEEVLNEAHPDYIVLASMLCFDFMKGLSAWDLKKKYPEGFKTFCNTLGNTIKVISNYADLIQTFFINDILPQNIRKVKTMVRRAVPASDTDSSIYTTQNQVEWYSGKIDWSSKSIAAASITSFLSSSIVAHAMLKISGQLNVDRSEITRVDMKGEFFMPVLMVSNLTKHYGYLEEAKEGKIYTSPKMSCRGVGLKSSKLPNEIINKSFEWYEKVMIAIKNSVVMTPRTVMAYPAYIENIVLREIGSGDVSFFSKESVKNYSNYKKPSSSPYLYIELWNRVFARKYGEVVEFPTACKKIPVTINNKQRLAEWIDTLEPSMAESMKTWLGEVGRDKFGHVLVPINCLPKGKLIKELLPIIDTRGLLNELTEHAYVYMSMLGINIKDSNVARLCSDYIDIEESLEEFRKIDMDPIEGYI